LAGSASSPTDRRVRRATRPGQYKLEPNHVIRLDGTIHYYVDPLKVTDEMEKLLQYYNESRQRLHPVELAAQIHYGFVVVHPFVDGNGRVARLLMNLVLLQSDYPPAIIRNEAREDYYRALMTADEGDMSPFIDLVAQEVQRAFDVIFDVTGSPVRYGPNDVKKQLERLERQVRLRTEAERKSELHLEQRWNNLLKVRDRLEEFYCRYASRGNRVRMRVDKYEGSINDLSQHVRNAIPQESLEQLWTRIGAVRLMIVAAIPGKHEILGHIIGLVFEAPDHYDIALFPSRDSSFGNLAPLGSRFRLIQARDADELAEKESEVNEALVNCLRAVQI
jgi:prophage maintenance system killer protein